MASKDELDLSSLDISTSSLEPTTADPGEEEELSFSDIADTTTTSDLFASPPRTRRARSSSKPSIPNTPTPLPSNSQIPSQPNHEDRETSLKQELSLLKSINSTLSNVIFSLTVASNNINVLNNTVNSSTALLDTYTRILSQTENNQRLLLNLGWEGTSQDAALSEKLERESKEREREGKEREKLMQERRVAEEERRRLATTEKEGTGRGRGRGRGTTGRGYTGVGGQGGRPSSSRGGGTGRRGTTTGRTRGRG